MHPVKSKPAGIAASNSIDSATIKRLVYGHKRYDGFKLIFDFAFSFGAFLFLLPLLILISIIIYIDDPKGSPFYVSKRCGKNGKLFSFYKFRTMVVGADERISEVKHLDESDGPVFKAKDDPRITRFGRFLRKSSLDELLQLINVMKGDMSMVGPRPALEKEVMEYTPYQRQRLAIRPGLTCLWQVLPKRNSVTFDEWVSLDLKYIAERSFLLDIKILIKTVGVIFTGEGV